MSEPLAKAAFLDRDGTINVNHGYISDPGRVELLPGAAEGIRLLRGGGYLVVVLTNQSGVARGWMTLDQVAGVNDRLRELLRAEGADWDDLYVCPHPADDMLAPGEGGCDCRKPRPANLYRAAEKWRVDVSRSAVIGDRASDVELGKRVGARTVFLLSEGHEVELSILDSPPDAIAEDLLQAARWVIGNEK